MGMALYVSWGSLEKQNSLFYPWTLGVIVNEERHTWKVVYFGFLV